MVSSSATVCHSHRLPGKVSAPWTAALFARRVFLLVANEGKHRFFQGCTVLFFVCFLVLSFFFLNVGTRCQWRRSNDLLKQLVGRNIRTPTVEEQTKAPEKRV